MTKQKELPARICFVQTKADFQILLWFSMEPLQATSFFVAEKQAPGMMQPLIIFTITSRCLQY